MSITNYIIRVRKSLLPKFPSLSSNEQKHTHAGEELSSELESQISRCKLFSDVDQVKPVIETRRDDSVELCTQAVLEVEAHRARVEVQRKKEVIEQKRHLASPDAALNAELAALK